MTTKAEPMKLFSVSHSKLATFRRCLQQYHWKYIDKYYPPSAIGQVRGTAGHAALAIWHTDYEAQPAMDAAWDVWQNNGYDNNDDWQLLEDALNRYFPWSQEHDTFKLLTAEKEFKLEFEGLARSEEDDYPEPFNFTGFIDGVVEENGQTWLLENKFYKKMDNSTKELDIQSTLYLLAAQMLGYDVKGVIYNMVRVADTKIAITEPVVRQRVYRNSAGFEHIKQEIQIQTAVMVRYQEGGRPYRNMTKDCSWDCPFYNACLSMLDDGQEPTDILNTLVNVRRNDDNE